MCIYGGSQSAGPEADDAPHATFTDPVNMLRKLPSFNIYRYTQRFLAPRSACVKDCSLFCTVSEGRPPDDINIRNIPVRGPKTSDGGSKDTNTTPGGFNTKDQNGRTRTTYDEEEVAKFRSMADSWWDPQGDCKPLHSLNRLRVALIREGLVQSHITKPENKSGPKPLAGVKVLDVGCGGGILCEPLARLGATVTGLDAAEENTVVARLHADQDHRVKHNVEYVHGTLEEHVQNIECQYDAVVASEVLEHMNDTELFVYTCADAIRPGGSLFLTTINKTTCAWLGAIAIAELAMHLLPPGTHDWDKFVPRQELLFMLEKNGFVTRTVHGMAYNPLVNEWVWVSNTSINYAVHAIKEGARV